MRPRIKVAVGELRDLTRQGILAELEDHSRYSVSGETLSARQVIELADAAHPDILALSAGPPRRREERSHRGYEG